MTHAGAFEHFITIQSFVASGKTCLQCVTFTEMKEVDEVKHYLCTYFSGTGVVRSGLSFNTGLGYSYA